MESSESRAGEQARIRLRRGLVIPACPLALHDDGRWSERHQRALVRYYADAGAGGVAVGVHSTQFAIRDARHGLLRPVLQLAAAEMRDWTAAAGMVRIAGICGETAQAVREAECAVQEGYEAGLVSLTALAAEPEEALVEHCRVVSGVLPVLGFYLQPAVGGRVLPYRFWRSLCDLPEVIGIKIAPFDRYATVEVMRAAADSGRHDLALYTGNDDHILGDLLTPFPGAAGRTLWMHGGLLGQWGVWTRRAVELLERVRRERETGRISRELLSWNAALTDANGAVFDAAHRFAGCIPGILEVLRGQGLVPGTRCLDPAETLSPGQRDEIERVRLAYPFLVDDAFVEANRDRWLG